MHNATAYEPGNCDCGYVDTIDAMIKSAEYMKFRMNIWNYEDEARRKARDEGRDEY